MPVDYYVGRTVEELQVLLRSAQDRKVRGAITEVTAAGVRTARDVSQIQSADREILNLRYSLYLRALGTDQAADWPDPRSDRVTRTRTRYV